MERNIVMVVVGKGMSMEMRGLGCSTDITVGGRGIRLRHRGGTDTHELKQEVEVGIE